MPKSDGIRISTATVVFHGMPTFFVNIKSYTTVVYTLIIYNEVLEMSSVKRHRTWTLTLYANK